MNIKEFPETLNGLHIHLVGAKGTGMTALAEILHHNGAILSGSDVPDVFYTDTILSSLGVKLASPFDVKNLPPDADLVIYSAAYSIEGNPELSAAHKKVFQFLVIQRRLAHYLPIASPQALPVYMEKQPQQRLLDFL